MKTKKVLRKGAVVLILLCLLVSCLGGFSASAATEKQITVTTNSDINPFLRVPLYSKTFGSGGPFTVRFEMKIESFSRTKNDANVFINIIDGRNPASQDVWLNTWTRKTNDWVDVKDQNGEYITFNNINKVLISGALENFGLLQFGIYYGDAVVHYRNFRILNAAGDVVYSWDTDTSLEVGNDIRDLSTITLYAETFGDGSAEYMVLESGDGATTTTEAPTTTKAPTTTTTKSDGPTGSAGNDDPTTQPSDSATTTIAGETTTGTDPSGTESTSSTVADTTSTTTSNDTSPTGDVDAPSGGLGTGAVVGIVIGVIVILAGGVIAVLFATKKLPPAKKDGAQEQ